MYYSLLKLFVIKGLESFDINYTCKDLKIKLFDIYNTHYTYIRRVNSM